MKQILLIITFLTILGCNQIDKKNLEVIEGIQLGTSYKIYKQQLDSLDIPSKSFFTKSIFADIGEVKFNQLDARYSDVFNLTEFRDNYTDHYSIICPVVLIGTDNVYRIDVLIGHTGPSTLINNGRLYNLTNEYKKSAFNQNISESLLFEIEKMLTSKYGKPISKGVESKYNKFYIFEGQEKKEFIGDNKRKGKVTEWETEYLIIKLFEGLPSSDAIYSNSGYHDIIQPRGKENEIVTDIDPYKGQSSCITYVYIQYELKLETINKLSLNDKKL